MEKIRQRAAIWDEVWAEYDARQVLRTALPPSARPLAPVRELAAAGLVPFRTEPGPAPGLAGFLPGAAEAGPRAGGPATTWPAAPPRPWEGDAALRRASRSRFRLVAQLAGAAIATALVLAAWIALPWLLGVRLAMPLGQGDAQELLRQMDAPAAQSSIRAGLAAEVPADESPAVRRFLGDMADRMAGSLAQPEGLRAWLRFRAQGARYEGAPALSGLRSARPVGLTAFRMEYGPRHESGGVAFDMAWQGDAFRVTEVRFLQSPRPTGPIVAVQPAPRRAPAPGTRAVVAMR